MPNKNSVPAWVWRSVVTVLMGVVAFFCVQTFMRLDRVEQKVNDIDARMAALQARMEDHFAANETKTSPR